MKIEYNWQWVLTQRQATLTTFLNVEGYTVLEGNKNIMKYSQIVHSLFPLQRDVHQMCTPLVI